MGYGKTLDRVAGGLSRLLHVRGARENTLADLPRYYDLTPAEMFPNPRPITKIHEERGLGARALGAITLSWPSAHEVLCDRYRQRHARDYRVNQTAWARWTRAERARRRTCLVYVHGWLEPGSWAEEATLFRKWHRELDVDIVHVALPFHGRRKPGASLFSGELFWTADLVRSVEGVRQAICDARSAIAWLRTQGYDRVGVTGISLGGALCMLLACLEPAPDFVIPIIAHLELADIIEHAPILWRVKHDLEKWGVGHAQRAEIFARLGLAGYRPVVPRERQLWIEAREDVYIDPRLVEAQWKAWGEPHILWIDGGHMTFPLHVGALTDRMRVFLDTLPGG
jgi:hypothetical protein